jgi:hypothetical protein
MGLDHWLVARKNIMQHDWRKFNALHAWFVDNVNGGEEINCNEKGVRREELEKLLSILEAAWLDKENAGQYLPTRGGFFFGQTEYNEWYWNDVEETIDVLKNFLALDEDTEFFYNAWW